MTAAESGTTTEANSADVSTDSEPNEPAETSSEAVSWGPPESNRLRSFSIGGLAGAIVAAVVWLLLWLPAGIAFAVVFLLVFIGPFVVWLVNVADELSTETERHVFRERLRLRRDWSGLHRGWTISGTVIIGGTAWLLWTVGGVVAVINTAPMAVVVLLALLQQEMDTTTTVDPQRGIIKTERPDRTKRQSLDWAVGLRRFDLFNWRLFVFSNRGKRWYEGPHMLSVPAELASEVEPRLRQLVDRNDSPPRIGRDERIIIGAIGAALLGIGPLLYLLSGERALLLIIIGPSALVAHFAQLHARRG